MSSADMQYPVLHVRASSGRETRGQPLKGSTMKARSA